MQYDASFNYVFGEVNGHIEDLWKIPHLLVSSPKVHSIKLLIWNVYSYIPFVSTDKFLPEYGLLISVQRPRLHSLRKHLEGHYHCPLLATVWDVKFPDILFLNTLF